MAEKKAQHGKNSVDETGFLAQSTRHPFRDPDSPREPDPQETKVKKILSSVFAVVFAMAFSLVCQPSVSSAAPQGAPATRQNQPAHQSVRNVKQNHAAPAAAGREPQSSRSEKAHGSPGTGRLLEPAWKRKDSPTRPARSLPANRLTEGRNFFCQRLLLKPESAGR